MLHYWRDHMARASRTDDHYSDNRFSALKVHHFLEQDRKPDFPLVLWGAGNKGKLIARLLLENGISFHWICNNSRKWNTEVYGVRMNDMSMLSSSSKSQVIVGVSTFHGNDDVERLIKEQHQHQYFCFY